MAAGPELAARPAPLVPVIVGAAALLALITWIDYATGYEFGFFVFYFIPISLAVWYAGRGGGIAFAFAGAICWYLSDRLTGHQYSREWFVYWESFMRLVSFLTIALALSKIRASLARERRLNQELVDSLERVRQLEGLIPVCAWCRRVRDDSGYWKRFEAYLATRTGATFTHGICPSCAAGLEAPPPFAR